MSPPQRRAAFLLIGVGAMLVPPREAAAQLQVDWYTIDGGGGTSSGGGLTLSGTFGQPDAGGASGGAIEMRCGFWAAIPGCRVDLDSDGQVTSADLATCVSLWFASVQAGTLEADFDGNGAVTPADVGLFVQAWFAALSTGTC